MQEGEEHADPAAIHLLRKTLSVDALSADPDLRLPDAVSR